MTDDAIKQVCDEAMTVDFSYPQRITRYDASHKAQSLVRPLVEALEAYEKMLGVLGGRATAALAPYRKPVGQ